MEDRGVRWAEMVGKRARSSDGLYLGKVQEINPDFILTTKGVFRRESFSLPRESAQGFDGAELRFDLTANEVKIFEMVRGIDKETFSRRGLTLAEASRRGMYPIPAKSTTPCSFCALAAELLRSGSMDAFDLYFVRRHLISMHGVNYASFVRDIPP